MRKLYPALAGLVLSAGLLVTTAVAQAAPTTARAPRAPAVSAARHAIQFASTAEPSISPAPYRHYHVPWQRPGYSCPSSELCLQVFDPVTEDFIIFELYYCKTYTLYNWNDNGTYRDNQTGGVESDFIAPPDTDIYPDGGILHNTNWTPYNWINSC